MIERTRDVADVATAATADPPRRTGCFLVRPEAAERWKGER